MIHQLFLVIITVPWMRVTSCWQENQEIHQMVDLHSNSSLLTFLALDLEDNNGLWTDLTSMLIVRPPESEGNFLVREMIRDKLEVLGWSVELVTFTAPDPVTGQMVTFTNIVATLWPDRPRLLTLACHYDSKTFPMGFLGATDSAVPCVILLNIVTTLNFLLLDQEGEVSLQLVFFDGEEQLHENTLFGPDGLYGSKHMANRLATMEFNSEPGPWCQSGQATEMSRIDHLLLLDLIGAPAPRFNNYINKYIVDAETGLCDQMFTIMSDIEDRIINLGCGDCLMGPKMFIPTCDFVDNTLDDHSPFLERGLRHALHIISDPFPEVWHTMEDDWDHLDLNTVVHVNRVIRIFVAEYLDILKLLV